MIKFIKKIFSFNFKGRANRKEFLLGALLLGGIGTLFAIGFIIWGKGLKSVSPFVALFQTLMVIVSCCLIIIVIINGTALWWRRMHDINHSGWYGYLIYVLGGILDKISSENKNIYLVCISILVDSYCIYIFLLKKGTPGPNRFDLAQYKNHTSRKLF